MEKNIFEILTENAINERLDDTILHDDAYQKIKKKIDHLMEQFDKLNLTKEHRLIIDRLISAHIECGSCYGRVTYQQGVRDCALLLMEMGLIK